MAGSQYGVTSLLVFTACMIIYQALISGVPPMKATFMYESMYSSNVFSRNELLGNPVYELRKSARMQQLTPPEYHQRKNKEKVVFFFIPGNMGGYVQLPPISNAIDNYTMYLNEQ
jgi:hypothetical protein